MRLIDADRLLRPEIMHLYYHLKNGDTAIPVIDIERAPTAVITCENCNWSQKNGASIFCRAWNRYTAHSGFCHQSEVKRGQQKICLTEKEMELIKEQLKNATITVEAGHTEVIQCQNCKHRGEDECPMRHVEYVTFEDDGLLDTDMYVEDNTQDEGFCNLGEREENE